MNTSQTIRLGYVPLLDAAPLIVAQEFGLYKKYDLTVNLSRELGWATIRDKVIYGELDAVHALGAMPLAATLGLGSIAIPCVTGMVLNQHGNAITLSAAHGSSRDPGHGLRMKAQQKQLVFGVVFPSSTHHSMMRLWLKKNQLEVGKHARIITLPPSQIGRTLTAGIIDGYCVGEPWNTQSVQLGEGYVVAFSQDLLESHPEKVLMTTQSWARRTPDLNIRLIAALMEACAWCANSTNHGHLAYILSARTYLNCPSDVIMPGLSGKIDCGTGAPVKQRDVIRFHGGTVNIPNARVATSYVDVLSHTGLLSSTALEQARVAATEVYSESSHREALALMTSADSLLSI